MQPIEARILSVLRPEDMLRFVLRTDRSAKVRFEIEGAQASVTTGLLAERLELILNAMRSNGYLFSAKTAPEKRGCSPNRKARNRKKASGTWVCLLPRLLQVPVTQSHGLGFGAESRETDVECRVELPDLPRSAGPTLFDRPASLIASAPQVDTFEIEFVRKDLPAAWIPHLEQAFRLHTFAAQEKGDTPFNDSTLIQAFLALWISQRSGWEVQLRTLLKPGAEVPTSILEVIGREIFSCECEVCIDPDVAHPSTEAVPMGSWYPKGWPFPPILPLTNHCDGISANRLHNINLPHLPGEGMLIGRADGHEIRMPLETRDRHTYVVGATGTGKTTLLLRMIREDIRRGEGVILIDPHGDLYKATLDAVPRKRRKQLFLLDPLQEGDPPGLNILDIPPSRLRQRHASFVVGELFRFFEETWNMRDAGGPTFEMYFRNTMLLLCLQGLAAEEQPYNIHAFAKVMTSAEFRKRLVANCPDRSVVAFWEEIATKTTGDYRLENIVPYICSKVNAFTQGGFVAQLLGAERNEFRLAQRMDRGEVILLNLNKGFLGSYESRLLGTILMMEIFAAGLQRSLRPVSERRPVNIYVDEFQNFISDNVAAMLSEARKFGLRLTLANQTLAQLRSNPGRQDLLEAVLGNVGNMILFRLGVPDSNRLAQFIEPFTPQQMQELPNFHALTRLLTHEGPLKPFVLKSFKK